MAKLGCLAKVGKGLLIALNILFLILSLVLLVVGALVKWGQSLFDQYLSGFLTGLISSANSASGGALDNLPSIDLNVLLGDVATALVVMGCILLLISIMGCCGACYNVRWMLIVYSIIISLIFLAQVVIVILLFTKTEEMRNVIKGPMKTSIQNNYVSFNSTDLISLGWNFGMMAFKCCGVENYTDFQTASKWSRTYTEPTYGVTVNLTTPIACCKVQGDFPNFQPPSDYNCSFTPTTSNSNYMNGCYQAIEDFVFLYDTIFIGVGCGLAVFQIILIVFSCMICHALGKDNEIKPFK